MLKGDPDLLSFAAFQILSFGVLFDLATSDSQPSPLPSSGVTEDNVKICIQNHAFPKLSLIASLLWPFLG
jgi:hypothetical protein